MIRFLKNSLGFLIICLVSSYILAMLADGNTDDFYLKFTTPKQQALILGSSRAAQGINPTIINNNLQESKLYNYAFSRVHTPYGLPYLKSIEKKWDTTKQGYFILEINPWILSDYDKEPGITANEANGFIGKVKHVTIKPNWEYLWYGYNKRYVNLLYNKLGFQNKKMFLHANGWLEVTLPEKESLIKKRTENTLKRYQGIAKTYTGLAEHRLEVLQTLITNLKALGPVYLVRLPIAREMHNVEQSYAPQFDETIKHLSYKLEVEYWNFSNNGDSWTYIDGHHLDQKSIKKISAKLADSIKKYNQ